jgi:hypothetical protein
MLETKWQYLGDTDKRMYSNLKKLGIDFIRYDRDSETLPSHIMEVALIQRKQRIRTPVLFRGQVVICRGAPSIIDLKYLLSMYPDSGVVK